jgi:hypothetical protein
MTIIKYCCRFVNASGAFRDVTVSLSRDEVEDVLRHRRQNPDGAGGVGGPLERGYAWRRAARAVPQGYEPLFDCDRRVVVN